MSKTSATLVPAVFKTDDDGDKVLDTDGKAIVETAGFYTNDDGVKVAVITEGSGKTVKRWIKTDLTATELATIRGGKGHGKGFKICKAMKGILKMVKDLGANADQVLTADERHTLAQFILANANTASDMLEGAAAEEEALPFSA